jgi:hypothetical protein
MKARRSAAPVVKPKLPALIIAPGVASRWDAAAFASIARKP